MSNFDTIPEGEEFYLGDLEQFYGFENVASEFCDQTRWNVWFLEVTKDLSTGKLYGYRYGHGATEMQEDYQFTKSDMFEVEPYEVTEIKYRKKQ